MLMSRRGMPRFIGHCHLDGRGALRPHERCIRVVGDRRTTEGIEFGILRIERYK
jgi:hypothetical protein